MMNRMTRMMLFSCCACVLTGWAPRAVAQDSQYEYRVLATNKTSTMEKEMNEAAAAGFRLSAAMGGAPAFGGKEAVVVMIKGPAINAEKRSIYRLLATSKTSTMQKEMQHLAEEGFEYRGQTVFKTTFGGEEVCVIMERDTAQTSRRMEYKLLATSKTSTMQKELQEAGSAGFRLVGLTGGQTAFGGAELVSILEKAVK
jgi:PleD family two-component response regulator